MDLGRKRIKPFLYLNEEVGSLTKTTKRLNKFHVEQWNMMTPK